MSSPNPILRITVVGLVSLAIAMGIGRFAFTPLLPLMQQDDLVGIADGGVLASVHFLGYWLGAVLVDKLPFSPKKTLRLSLLAIGIATLGMGMTDSFTAWLVLRWLCGLCSAFILVLISNHYVKYLAETGHARMQGCVFSGVGVGIALAGLGTLAIMVRQIGSAASWQIFGAVSLAAIAVVWTLVGSEVPDTRAAKQTRQAPRSPLLWSIVIAYGAMGIGYIIPATYLPVMAKEIVQSPLIFGWSWPVFGLAAFLSTLVAAPLHGYFTNRQIWAVGQLVMAAGMLLPIVYPHIATIIVAGICVGGTFMVITMAGMKEAHRVAPAHDVQRHIAAMTVAFATGQMIGPFFASWIYEATRSFSIPLLATSLALAATAVTLLGRSSKEEVLRA